MKKHQKIRVVVKAIGFFALWLALTSLLPYPNPKNPAVWRFWAELIPLLSLVFSHFVFLKGEKEKITISLFQKIGSDFAVGIIGGSLWLFSGLFILQMANVMHFETFQPVSFLGIWLLSAFLNVVMQELLMRGYMYQLLKNAYCEWVAVVVMSLVFVLLHAGALEEGIIAVLNILTTNLMLNAWMEYRKSLLVPILFHFIWNAIGSIVFGIVSLAEDYPSILHFTFDTKSFLVGTKAPLEGSVVVLVLNGLFLFWAIYRRKKEKVITT